MRNACHFGMHEVPASAAKEVIVSKFPAAAQKSKDCPYKFATKLPAPSGNATWHVPEKIPDSTVYIRAWLWTEQADGTFKQTNYGRTKGNWQVCKFSICNPG